MRGRVALITGADTRGMGRAIAFGLAWEGAAVALGYHTRPERGERAAAGIRHVGGSAEAVRLDVTSAASVKLAFNDVERMLGLVDCLVCCAAVIERERVVESTDVSVAGQVAVNVEGTLRVNREFVSRLLAAGRPGSIVNVGSITRTVAGAGMPTYAATKGAIWSMSRALAGDLAGHGIRVNTVSPGSFLTDFNRHLLNRPGATEERARSVPLGRIGRPRDIVGAVVFLASDAAGYVTGADIRVDGGRSVV
jgi:NAD(P)-dependent dehydrogenase (short-subunit alcohol dehydrogenase family)